MLGYVLLAAITVAYAQVPTPCQSPTAWEGRERVTEFGKNFQEWHKLYYDFLNLRERNIAEVEEGSTRDFFDILYLYKERREYRINMRTRECNSTELTRIFRPRGVPAFSKFDYTFTLGATGIAGEYVTIQSFRANLTDGNQFYGLVTNPTCTPVQDFYTEDSNTVSISYFDITVGISDPMAFVPPSECFTK